MFFKNFITKSLFLFILGSFIGLSSMERNTKDQAAEAKPSVQSVFGQRLRLKNNTDNRLATNPITATIINNKPSMGSGLKNLCMPS